MRKLLFIVCALALVGLVSVTGNASAHAPSTSSPVAQAPSAQDDDEVKKVTFCHATSSATNPYVEITTSVSAFFNAGHIDHDDIWPAFTYVKQGKTLSVPAQGDQSLLATGCVAPPPPPADQCPDGTNPGDADGDGTADADDCGFVPPPPPPADQCPDGTNPGDVDGDGTADADDCTAVLPDVDTKVTFCHATSSATNPYVEITTSVSAFFNAGHIDHGDDIWPAFTYVKQGKTFSVPAQGDQSLLATGCVAPPPPPADDQCPDGSNPGDANGDGTADADDCGFVPPPPPADDQCPDGTNPGDANGDGTADADDCVTDPPPPADDQCPDGTNPGDANGDGTADADDCVTDPPLPVDDQCPDGSNPGDANDDGTVDVDDCTAVLPESGTNDPDPEDTDNSSGGGSGGDAGGEPEVSSDTDTPVAVLGASGVRVPNVVDAGVGVPALRTVTVTPASDRPFAGGPWLLAAGVALLAGALARPAGRRVAGARHRA